MNNNCSLVNPEKSCKCIKKTKAAIEAGYINPDNLQYTPDHLGKIRNIVENNEITIQDMIGFQNLYRDHPYKIFESSEFIKMVN